MGNDQAVVHISHTRRRESGYEPEELGTGLCGFVSHALAGCDES
jgi:hypothetical protein